MAKRSNQRRRARELALQYLYQRDLLATRGFEPELAPAAFCRQHDASEETAAFADVLIRGVIEHLAQIDAAIHATAKNWTLERMVVVDRSILRLATYELVFRPDIPPKVSINEAIELAKKFSTQRSSSFVNGILDRIRATHAAAAAAPPSGSGSHDAPRATS